MSRAIKLQSAPDLSDIGEGSDTYGPNSILLPFLKWAGGKRWLVQGHPEVFPGTFERYIEPFLGSGAVFFYLQPRRALLSDWNVELMEVYLALRENYMQVVKLLRQHQRKHASEYYYRIRSSVPRSISGRAARFIYLNRTCWNGLYRVNRDGTFNVPIGTRNSVIRKTDEFALVSKLLERAELVSGDFEPMIDRAASGDLLFVDPPYTVKHNSNNFIKYNEQLFSWDDQLRLKAALLRAKRRKVKIVLTNADHASVKALFGDLGRTLVVQRQSAIAADSERRKSCEELIIQSWR